MAKISFKAVELRVLLHTLEICLGGGDLHAAMEFLEEEGDIRTGQVDLDALMEKIRVVTD